MSPAPALALLFLGTAVIEHAVHSGARARRGGRPTVAAGYAVLGWAVTGSWLLAAAAVAGGSLVPEALRRRYGYPPASWTAGVAAVLSPYAGVWAAWAVVRPQVHLPLGRLLEALWHRLGGTAPPDEAALVGWAVAAAAFVFNVESANVLVRGLLGGLAAEPAGPASPAQPAAFLRAGRLIGILERLLVLCLGLAGQLGAIGLVLAAKSVARFDFAREQAEYFLVGTLASVTIALVSVLVCRAAGALP